MAVMAVVPALAALAALALIFLAEGVDNFDFSHGGTTLDAAVWHGKKLAELHPAAR